MLIQGRSGIYPFGFQVFAAAIYWAVFFWIVTLCSPTGIYLDVRRK
jgi:hypothetical protein